MVWRPGPWVDRLALPAHLIDVPLFGLLIFLTEGATSPFFAFFIFALLAAALRWQARGVVWTGLAVLIVYGGVSLYAAEILDDPGFELNRFLIRLGYLAVVVLLLGYLSVYEQRLRDQRIALAAWPASGRAPGRAGAAPRREHPRNRPARSVLRGGGGTLRL
jgi:hypothetical protein